MIVEERIYTLKVGVLNDYIKNYEEHGLAAQKRILGHLVGWYHTEFGALNQIVHMWAYENLEERALRRVALFKDPDFLHCLSLNRPLIASQENKLLIPASFSPIPKIN